MNHQEFKEVVLEQHEQSLNVLAAKADEYSKDHDRFWNFNRAAAMLNITPERALVGMLAKHLVSILDMVDDEALCFGYSTSFIDEKIGDAIAYLLLLKGMMLEKADGK